MFSGAKALPKSINNDLKSSAGKQSLKNTENVGQGETCDDGSDGDVDT